MIALLSRRADDVIVDRAVGDNGSRAKAVLLQAPRRSL